MALTIEPTVVSDGHGAGLGDANKPHEVGSPVSTTGRLHANAAGKDKAERVVCRWHRWLVPVRVSVGCEVGCGRGGVRLLVQV